MTHRLLWLVLLLIAHSRLHAADSPHGAIATVHPLATELARSLYLKGGNAVDAAVGAGLALGVVDGHNSGIGGGCFFLIRLPSGRFVAVDGRETAPRGASPSMFLRDGKPDPQASQTGALAIGTPGALAAYHEAVSRYGRLPFRVHLLAAAELAEKGFPLQAGYAARIRAELSQLQHDKGCRNILLTMDGMPRLSGEMLKQYDLACSYRSIAMEGVGWMYRGTFAEALDNWMRENGGVLRKVDLENYRIRLREPVRSRYRGYEIVGFPPPSSGGVHVAEILNILEGFDLKTLGRRSPEFVHVVAEAMKLAFADRAHWLGDPDFVRVPRGLATKKYAEGLRSRIQWNRASEVPGHAVPEDADVNWYGKHTTHFTTADDQGYWVACTATINTSFGAKVVVPGTGVFLNNQMDDFSTAPGFTNFFGLLGGEANAVASLKRPLSSMSPTMVSKRGKPVLTVGAAGGPTIISQSVLAIIGVVDFGLTVDQSLAEPRFHHQWRPDELRIESGFSASALAELRRLGHNVSEVEALGACQAIERQHGAFRAAHDPRVEGKSLSW